MELPEQSFVNTVTQTNINPAVEPKTNVVPKTIGVIDNLKYTLDSNEIIEKINMIDPYILEKIIKTSFTHKFQKEEIVENPDTGEISVIQTTQIRSSLILKDIKEAIKNKGNLFEKLFKLYNFNDVVLFLQMIYAPQFFWKNIFEKEKCIIIKENINTGKYYIVWLSPAIQKDIINMENHVFFSYNVYKKDKKETGDYIPLYDINIYLYNQNNILERFALTKELLMLIIGNDMNKERRDKNLKYLIAPINYNLENYNDNIDIQHLENNKNFNLIKNTLKLFHERSFLLYYCTNNIRKLFRLLNKYRNTKDIDNSLIVYKLLLSMMSLTSNKHINFFEFAQFNKNLFDIKKIYYNNLNEITQNNMTIIDLCMNNDILRSFLNIFSIRSNWDKLIKINKEQDVSSFLLEYFQKEEINNINKIYSEYLIYGHFNDFLKNNSMIYIENIINFLIKIKITEIYKNQVVIDLILKKNSKTLYEQLNLENDFLRTFNDTITNILNTKITIKKDESNDDFNKRMNSFINNKLENLKKTILENIKDKKINITNDMVDGLYSPEYKGIIQTLTDILFQDYINTYIFTPTNVVLIEKIKNNIRKSNDTDEYKEIRIKIVELYTKLQDNDFFKTYDFNNEQDKDIIRYLKKTITTKIQYMNLLKDVDITKYSLNLKDKNWIEQIKEYLKDDTDIIDKDKEIRISIINLAYTFHVKQNYNINNITADIIKYFETNQNFKDIFDKLSKSNIKPIDNIELNNLNLDIVYDNTIDNYFKIDDKKKKIIKIRYILPNDIVNNFVPNVSGFEVLCKEIFNVVKSLKNEMLPMTPLYLYYNYIVARLMNNNKYILFNSNYIIDSLFDFKDTDKMKDNPTKLYNEDYDQAWDKTSISYLKDIFLKYLQTGYPAFEFSSPLGIADCLETLIRNFVCNLIFDPINYDINIEKLKNNVRPDVLDFFNKYNKMNMQTDMNENPNIEWLTGPIHNIHEDIKKTNDKYKNGYQMSRYDNESYFYYKYLSKYPSSSEYNGMKFGDTPASWYNFIYIVAMIFNEKIPEEFASMGTVDLSDSEYINVLKNYGKSILEKIVTKFGYEITYPENSISGHTFKFNINNISDIRKKLKTEYVIIREDNFGHGQITNTTKRPSEGDIILRLLPIEIYMKKYDKNDLTNFNYFFDQFDLYLVDLGDANNMLFKIYKNIYNGLPPDTMYNIIFTNIEEGHITNNDFNIIGWVLLLSMKKPEGGNSYMYTKISTSDDKKLKKLILFLIHFITWYIFDKHNYSLNYTNDVFDVLFLILDLENNIYNMFTSMLGLYEGKNKNREFDNILKDNLLKLNTKYPLLSGHVEKLMQKPFSSGKTTKKYKLIRYNKLYF
jgi:hypothetical protein